MRISNSEFSRREMLGRGRFGLQFLNPAKAAAAATGLALIAVAARPAVSATGMTVTEHGVKVWVPESRFRGDMTFVRKNRWQVISPDRLPRSLRGDPVIATETVLGAFDSEEGRVSFYARERDRLKKRGTVRPYPVHRAAEYKLIPGAGNTGPGIAVYSEKNRLEYTLYLNRDGIVEFRPAKVRGLTISDSRVKYGIVPSFIGTDLVYDPRKFTRMDRLYVPSMNLYAGLVKGNGCVMVGVWPPGDQAVRLELKRAGGERIIDGLSIDTAGRSFFLSWLEGSNIWHCEPLKATYLERDTVIGWNRPFAAKWIARFFIRSEGINYPFYFRREKAKMWGRCIRGWFRYPFWFDGERTYFHFEKKFPPQGEALVYFLERDKGAAGASSPVEVMQRALGEKPAAKLLDFEGIGHRPLLEHGNAVCAMANTLQKIFDAGPGALAAEEKAQVEQYADDMAKFVRLIRERVFEYSDFVKRTRRLLETRKQADPELTNALRRIEQTLDEMEHRVKKLPRASLNEVRGWADQIKKLAGKARRGNSQRYKALARKCRSVAGGQDDTARDLSILAIRLTEQAAELGVGSRERVGLAEQIIARARQVLRRPTWWEPRRYWVPKRDPGIP